MIFVTVGTHEQPFDRLLRAVDELRRQGTIQEEVFLQTGCSDYQPKACGWARMLPYRQMVEQMSRARIVVTHGGPASFMLPLQMGKTPVVVPRQKQYGEHVNDHQVEFAREVSRRMGLILPVEEVDRLGEVLARYDTLAGAAAGEIPRNNGRFNRELDALVRGLFPQ